MTREYERPRQLLPRQSYLDAAWLERERGALFDRGWVWAGLVGDVAEPGDYL
ncbi:MAG: Rieske (2Fe-2S) protein, partial [Gammaproteobacteria bacterium]|nr:Rieske (2Fe-2S) protein [Gammaproteobacteria bacterium]